VNAASDCTYMNSKYTRAYFRCSENKINAVLMWIMLFGANVLRCTQCMLLVAKCESCFFGRVCCKPIKQTLHNRAFSSSCNSISKLLIVFSCFSVLFIGDEEMACAVFCRTWTCHVKYKKLIQHTSWWGFKFNQHSWFHTILLSNLWFTHSFKCLHFLICLQY